MTTPPSKKLQQLSLSEQDRSRPQQQKPEHHERASGMGRHSVLAGAITKTSTREPKVGKTQIRRRDEELVVHTVCRASSTSNARGLTFGISNIPKMILNHLIANTT